MREEYDVIIVGGGIVGAVLALLLAKTGKKIAIIEARSSSEKQPPVSLAKAIVLSHSSRIILEMIQLWDAFASYASPINEIHVSDQGHFGSSKIFAKDEKLPALGYVLSDEKIGTLIVQFLQAHSGIDIIQPAKFVAFCYKEQKVTAEIMFKDQRVFLKGKLLIGSDGVTSSVRKFLGIETKTIDYQQTAILCHVDLKRSHENIAYERFTRQGPLAVLPLLEKKVAVIWTASSMAAKALCALPQKEFITKLQKNFGYRLGKLEKCSELVSIPIQLITAKQQISPGAVLIGNAVHTLHPVGGQGLNLALRDIAVLAEVIQKAENSGKPLGDLQLLETYLERRRKDQEQVTLLTHSLVSIFSNSLFPVIFARSMGMIMLDRMKSLKKILTKRALGFAGDVPRLACGISLE